LLFTLKYVFGVNDWLATVHLSLIITLKYVFGVNDWLATVHLSFIITILAMSSFFCTSFFSEILMNGVAFYFGSKENSRSIAISDSQIHFKSEKN
jgi:hypothetical protein